MTLLEALLRLFKRQMPTERRRDLIASAIRYLRPYMRAGLRRDEILLAIYERELDYLEIRRRGMYQGGRRPSAAELVELRRNNRLRRYLIGAIKRIERRKSR